MIFLNLGQESIVGWGAACLFFVFFFTTELCYTFPSPFFACKSTTALIMKVLVCSSCSFYYCH